MTADRIRERMERVRTEISSLQRSQAAQATPAHQITLASLQAHLDELKQQLSEAYADHGQEVIELKLRGKRAEQVQVPLRLLSRVADHLLGAILTASTHIKTGLDSRRVPKSVEKTLDLSFAGLQAGSSRLFFTLRSQPDLFGESLAEATLKSTFDVLSKSSFDELLEEVDTIGLKSLKNLHHLFSDVLSERLELDLVWTDVDAKLSHWTATHSDLTTWKKRIEGIRSQELPPITLTGIVGLMSLSGRIELLLDSGEKIRAIFPMKLLDEVRQVTISDEITGVFRRRNIVDMARGTQRTNYMLESLSRTTD